MTIFYDNVDMEFKQLLNQWSLLFNINLRRCNVSLQLLQKYLIYSYLGLEKSSLKTIDLI